MSSPPPSDGELAFHLGQVFTKALRELYKAFDGDLTMALVLGEVGQYAVASLYEKPPNGRRASARSVSTYSISLASGIPRETVRRKIDKLMALGWVVETPGGRLGLNLKHEPPLATLFAEYNREMLRSMHEAMDQLAGRAVD